MNVLWVTPAMPHPEGTGGCVHEFELIRALAGRHDIHVIQSAAASPLTSEPLLATGARHTEVPWLGRPAPTSKFGVARALIRAKPNLVHWLCRDRIFRLAEAIAAAGAHETPDLVHITHGELAELLRHVPYPTALLLFDVLTSVATTKVAVEPLRRRRAQLRLEARRSRQFERSMYSLASGLASVSSVDAQWLEGLLGRRVEVLENPVGDEFFEVPSVPRTSDQVTFVGALAHPPNADAIRWLATDIWPRVSARRPDAQLRVVGRGDDDRATASALRALVEGVGGTLHEDVPDIRPYYWGAAAVIAPLRHGSGLRNKVLHAMACQAPVVATPAALDGVPDDAARHTWVGSTAEDLTDRIIEVLDDSNGAATRAAAARSGLSPLGIDRISERHERWWEQSVR